MKLTKKQLSLYTDLNSRVTVNGYLPFRCHHSLLPVANFLVKKKLAEFIGEPGSSYFLIRAIASDKVVNYLRVSDLWLGDHFRYHHKIWCLIGHEGNHAHILLRDTNMLKLGRLGFGYKGSSMCTLDKNEIVEFIPLPADFGS